MSEDQDSIAGIPIIPVRAKKQQMSMLLWGDPGCGKTTLAATAPGVKLFINADPNGTVSIADRDDIMVMDIASAQPAFVLKGAKNNPFNIGTFLKEHAEVETIVVDSLTAYGMRCMEYAAVNAGLSKSTIFKPTLEAYGYRMQLMLQFVRNMLALAVEYDKHIIFTCHEEPVYRTVDGNTIVDKFSLTLGGKLNHNVPLQLSEIWNVRDEKGSRLVAVREQRQRAPMKTRMFKTSGTSGQFALAYNADEPDDQLGIAGWYSQWQANGFAKINLPK